MKFTDFLTEATSPKKAKLLKKLADLQNKISTGPYINDPARRSRALNNMSSWIEQERRLQNQIDDLNEAVAWKLSGDDETGYDAELHIGKELSYQISAEDEDATVFAFGITDHKAKTTKYDAIEGTPRDPKPSSMKKILAYLKKEGLPVPSASQIKKINWGTYEDEI